MTDETYTFISDVKEKKSVARSGGKKGKSRRGCTLSSDNLTTKEKRQMNGDMVSISMDRPMSYAKFQALSEDLQKKYLQNVINNHGGNTSRIAYMFEIEESRVKKLRQNLHIESRYVFGGEDNLWKGFLASADFLKKPMTWKTFKTLDKFDQQEYLAFLYDECGGTGRSIAAMLGVSSSYVNSFIKRNGFQAKKIGKGGRSSNNDIIKWNEFVGKTEKQECKNPTPLEEALNELANFKAESVQLKGPEKIEFLTPADIAPTVKEINIEFSVEKVEDIKLLLGVIPKADKGTITFRFGD